LIYLSVIELGATPVRLVSLARVSVRAGSGFRAAELKSLQIKARNLMLVRCCFAMYASCTSLRKLQIPSRET
jgi:hypothetical protein